MKKEEEREETRKWLLMSLEQISFNITYPKYLIIFYLHQLHPLDLNTRACCPTTSIDIPQKCEVAAETGK